METEETDNEKRKRLRLVWPKRQQSDYVEKLKDPRWQKLRLEILSRDKWTCQNCYAEMQYAGNLQVHHKYYQYPPIDPWEYPKEDLITYCERCHLEDEQERGQAENALLFALRKRGIHAKVLRMFASEVDKMIVTRDDPQLIFYAMMGVLTDKDLQEQAVEAFYAEILGGKL